MTPHLVSTKPDSPTGRPPLLFVHGAWHGAWCWENFQPWFSARGWETHAIDLRGHGATPNDRSLRFTRIKHYVEDLGSAVQSLDSPPVIVAHSMGGLVAQAYLENADLPGAVLLAPVPMGGVWRATLRVMRRHPIKFLKANLTWSLGPLVEDLETAAGLFLPGSTSDDEKKRHWQRMQPESYLAYLDMLFLVRPRPQLVQTPVAIVAAAGDRLFGVAEMERTAKVYGIEAVVLPDAAHDLMLGPGWETAAEAVAAAARGFGGGRAAP